MISPLSSRGKSGMISIQRKLDLCREFDRVTRDPTILFPEKEMLQKKIPGVYQGCFASTKWPASRISQKWDFIVDLAPRFARKYAEVPKWIRTVLGMERLKAHRKAATLPVELEGILEKASNAQTKTCIQVQAKGSTK